MTRVDLYVDECLKAGVPLAVVRELNAALVRVAEIVEANKLHIFAGCYMLQVRKYLPDSEKEGAIVLSGVDCRCDGAIHNDKQGFRRGEPLW